LPHIGTKIKVIGVIVVIAAVAGAAFYLYNQSQTAAKKARLVAQAERTLTQTAAVSDLQTSVTASGTVVLSNEQVINSQTNEPVKTVLVKLGDKVQVGQHLVQYNTENTKTNLDNQIAQAQIQLKNAQLSLQSLGLSPDQVTLNNARSSVDTATASVQNAQHTITNLTDTIKQQQIAVVNAQQSAANAQTTVDNAQAALDNAQKNQADNKLLLDAGAISQQAYQTYVTAVTTAQSQLDSAKSQLAAAQAQVVAAQDAVSSSNRQMDSNQTALKNAQITLNNANASYNQTAAPLSTQAEQIKYQQQQATVQNAQLQLQNLQNQLDQVVDYADSPIAGTISKLSVTAGASYQVNSEMMRVADFNEIEADANVSQYDAPNLQLGQEVRMTNDGIPGVTFNGKITQIADSAVSVGAVSGTEIDVPIVISIDSAADNSNMPVSNANRLLKPNFDLNLVILTQNTPNVLNIPTSAIQINRTDPTHPYVYTVQNDRLKKTNITVGTHNDTNTEITSGLNEGDTFIVSPTNSMTDGMTTAEAAATTPMVINGMAAQNNTPGRATSGVANGMAPGGGGGGPGGGGGGNRTVMRIGG